MPWLFGLLPVRKPENAPSRHHAQSAAGFGKDRPIVGGVYACTAQGGHKRRLAVGVQGAGEKLVEGRGRAGRDIALARHQAQAAAGPAVDGLTVRSADARAEQEGTKRRLAGVAQTGRKIKSVKRPGRAGR